MINEVDNVTREELRLNDYVMCCKPITGYSGFGSRTTSFSNIHEQPT